MQIYIPDAMNRVVWKCQKLGLMEEWDSEDVVREGYRECEAAAMEEESCGEE